MVDVEAVAPAGYHRAFNLGEAALQPHRRSGLGIVGHVKVGRQVDLETQKLVAADPGVLRVGANQRCPGDALRQLGDRLAGTIGVGEDAALQTVVNCVVAVVRSLGRKRSHEQPIGPLRVGDAMQRQRLNLGHLSATRERGRAKHRVLVDGQLAGVLARRAAGLGRGTVGGEKHIVVTARLHADFCSLTEISLGRSQHDVGFSRTGFLEPIVSDGTDLKMTVVLQRKNLLRRGRPFFHQAKRGHQTYAGAVVPHQGATLLEWELTAHHLPSAVQCQPVGLVGERLQDGIIFAAPAHLAKRLHGGQTHPRFLVVEQQYQRRDRVLGLVFAKDARGLNAHVQVSLAVGQGVVGDGPTVAAAAVDVAKRPDAPRGLRLGEIAGINCVDERLAHGRTAADQFVLRVDAPDLKLMANVFDQLVKRPLG